jgi:hypothetical protein
MMGSYPINIQARRKKDEKAEAGVDGRSAVVDEEEAGDVDAEISNNGDEDEEDAAQGPDKTDDEDDSEEVEDDGEISNNDYVDEKEPVNLISI